MGFFSFNQCQVDFIFKEVMIRKGRGGAAGVKHLQVSGTEPLSALQLDLPKKLSAFRKHFG